MKSWSQQLADCLKQQVCVLVTVGAVKGSAPREPGARMLVTDTHVSGTIGGGNLEFTAIQQARQLLTGAAAFQQQRYGLGPRFKQCCGGAVTLLYEVFAGPEPVWLRHLRAVESRRATGFLITPVEPLGEKEFVEDLTDPRVLAADFASLENGLDITLADFQGRQFWIEKVYDPSLPLVLFGAGHVGQALVPVLAPLHFSITWVDSRAEIFPSALAPDVRKVVMEDCRPLIEAVSADTLFLVMTHSHELDEEICYQVLKHNRFSWLGLIGSQIKAQRFGKRLRQRGIGEKELARLVCPIGLSGIQGKQPATIAVAVAAQLLLEFPAAV